MGARVLIVAALVAAGCQKTSSKYCELHGATDPLHCGFLDAPPVRCTSNAMCPSDHPRCDLTTGMCEVQCTDDGQCMTPTPHCDQSKNVCVECTDGSQCMTGVCLFGGTCQTADNTAYVDAASTSTTHACTMVDPCPTIQEGIATTKPYVHVTGQFSQTGGLSIANNVSVTLLADPGTASYTRPDQGTVITIGKNGMVAIQGLEIFCSVPMSIGISTGAGTFSFSQIDVHGCTSGKSGGIVIGGGSVTISRSRIHDNGGTGLTITGATGFDITNSFIYHNGAMNLDNPAGGVILGMGKAGAERFEFNTVVDNAVKVMPGEIAGIACPAGFTAPNNILARNYSGAMTTLTNASPGCATGSITDDPPNTFAQMGFVMPDASPPNYHITGASLAHSTGAPDPTITIDYDGDIRPLGSYDQGADEIP